MINMNKRTTLMTEMMMVAIITVDKMITRKIIIIDKVGDQVKEIIRVTITTIIIIIAPTRIEIEVIQEGRVKEICNNSHHIRLQTDILQVKTQIIIIINSSNQLIHLRNK